MVEEKKLNEIISKWSEDHPYDSTKDLPKGWEYRFGMCGRFMKYDSIEHAERKNKSTILGGLPFGYCNQQWERLKANLQPNDEIWIHGGNGGVTIYLIRNGKTIQDSGYYVVLSCY